MVQNLLICFFCIWGRRIECSLSKLFGLCVFSLVSYVCVFYNISPSKCVIAVLRCPLTYIIHCLIATYSNVTYTHSSTQTHIRILTRTCVRACACMCVCVCVCAIRRQMLAHYTVGRRMIFLNNYCKRCSGHADFFIRIE